MHDQIRERTALLVPLLQQLTEAFPSWAVWKNIASAFTGTGDIDSFAPRSDWPGIERLFRQWVTEQPELGPVIICRHIPQGPHFITLQRGSSYLLQLDVKERGTFRGSTLIDAHDLRSLSEIDDLGYRRIRPGAEGVIKLCMNATRRGAHPDRASIRAKQVAELLASDPAGVDAAATLLGPAAAATRRGAQAVIEGRWDRAAMRRVEAWSLARALAEPTVAFSRLWFLYYRAPRCPVVTLIRDHNRQVPQDRDRWLAHVASSGHLVIDGR